jgi:predicted acyltransferase
MNEQVITTPTSAQTQTASPSGTKSPRLMSLDALRGFDMLWILGGEFFIESLDKVHRGGFLDAVAAQFEHKEWEGFAFYDLIFPLFVFMVGISIVFSVGKIIRQEGKAAAHKRIFRRFALLFVVALIYSGGVSADWPNIRLLGVLNRIALAYLFAALIFSRFKWRGIVASCAGLLIGYWALMSFVPFPDVRPVNAQGEVIEQRLTTRKVSDLNFNSTKQLKGVFEPGLNLANYIDQKYLPGKKWDGTWDPEGLLSTIPAIGTCLLGVLVGLLLQNPSITDQKKVFILLGGGAAGVIAGFTWGLQFPVIKKIWTSSYVLVAGGYSALLMAAFYQIIEIWNQRKWATAFIWVGANPITLYLASNFLGGYGKLGLRLAGGDVKRFFDTRFADGVGNVVIAAVSLGIVIWFARFLYQRKIFLRL